MKDDRRTGLCMLSEIQKSSVVEIVLNLNTLT